VALDAHREEIRRIVAANRGRNPRVFGSVLHQDDTEASDLDLLIDAAEGMTLFDKAAIEADIERLTHTKVDVRTQERFVDEIPQQDYRRSKAYMTEKKALRVQDYIEHMLRAIEDQAAFERNTLVQDAVIRNFEIIGEAANKIQLADSTFAQRHPQLRRCPIIVGSTPPSLRAQRSNPGATARGPWIASSQGLLAMTVNGGVRVPRVDFLISGLRLN